MLHGTAMIGNKGTNLTSTLRASAQVNIVLFCFGTAVAYMITVGQISHQAGRKGKSQNHSFFCMEVVLLRFALDMQ